MFERLRKVFSASGRAAGGVGTATLEGVARWAADRRVAMVRQSVPGHFNLGGEVHGRPWRMECGPASRDYMHSLELRGRVDVGADTDAAVMVISRPLKELLEQRAYSAITDTLRTTVDAHLPEEQRWLSLFDEVAWPGLPGDFRRRYAVVAEHAAYAQRWLQPDVLAQLLIVAKMDSASSASASAPDAAAGQGALTDLQGSMRTDRCTPVVLMLVRGKVYVRLGHRRRSVEEVAAATDILLAAASAAAEHVVPSAVPGRARSYD